MTRTIDYDILKALLHSIEKQVNFKPSSPRDFNQIREIIYDSTGKTIGITTLKRLWGYDKGEHKPYLSTLDILSSFLGYANFINFCDSINVKNTKTKSSEFLEGTLKAEDLEPNQLICLKWSPNRVCLIQYQGNYLFEVKQVKNAKLMVGDTFRCQLFVNGQSLTVYDLTNSGHSNLTYTCGRGEGGITAELIE